MTAVQDTTGQLRRHSEKLALFAYFVAIGILSAPLARILARAWEAGNVTVALVYLPLQLGISLAQLTVVLIAVFLGFLVMMTLDPKKRWQGFLLSIGVVISLFVFRNSGLIFPHVDFLGMIQWWTGGFILGVLLVGNRQLTRVQTAEPFEFRRAPTAIFYVIAILTVAALLEIHISYPPIFEIGSNLSLVDSPTGTIEFQSQGFVSNVFIVGAFLFVLKRFMEYEAEKKFFVLGPPGSGKSLFMVGCYLAALNRANGDVTSPLNPSADLARMVDDVDQSPEGWGVQATAGGEMEKLQFRYIHGTIFPKYVTLAGLDYAGEYLDRLPDALTGLLDNEEDTTLRSLAEKVESADTIALVLDVERFVDEGDSLDISAYFPVLQAVDDTEVVLVATKADILAEQFEEERGLQAHRYFEDFTEYVNTELQQSENVRSLVQETAGAEIHPVFYQTTLNDADERIPMRNERGSVMTVGFNQLLNKIGQ